MLNLFFGAPKFLVDGGLGGGLLLDVLEELRGNEVHPDVSTAPEEPLLWLSSFVAFLFNSYSSVIKFRAMHSPPAVLHSSIWS